MDLIDSNAEYIFFVFGLLLFSPCLLFRSVFIRISILIYAYPIWIMFGLYIGLSASRIIKSTGLLYYKDSIPIALSSALLSYFAYLIVLFPVRNTNFHLNRFPLSANGRLFLLLLYPLAILLAYPSVLGFGAARFGSGGSIVVILSAILLCSCKKIAFDYISIMLMLFVTLAIYKGERVDFILIFVVWFAFMNIDYNFSFLKLVVALCSLLTVGVYAGVKRAGIDIDLQQLISLVSFSIINLGTAVDVVHVYLSSIWFSDYSGYSLLPLINLISSYLPFLPWGGASNEWNYALLLRGYINNVGGGLYYSVGAMTLGFSGVIIMGAILGLITKLLFIMRSRYSSFIFISFFIMQFRIQWYGLNYFGNVIFMSIMLSILLVFLRKYTSFIQAKGDI